MLFYKTTDKTYGNQCFGCQKTSEVKISNLKISHQSEEMITLALSCDCGATEFFSLNETHALLISRFLLFLLKDK